MLTWITGEEKAVTILAYLTQNKKLTCGQIARILYLADTQHMNEYGRPLYGENYLALPNGPTPAFLKDFLEDNVYFSSEPVQKQRYHFSIDDGVVECRMKPNMDKMSKSDSIALNIAGWLVSEKNPRVEGLYFNKAFYWTDQRYIIDWKLMLDVEHTEEQLEDLHFKSKHIHF